MISEEIRNIKSGNGELRKFGITMGIVLIVLSGLLWWREKEYYFWFLIPSALFIFLALIVPVALKPINTIWMTLAVLMSWVMTRVLLGMLFYLGITPMGFFARLFGKDFLNIKFGRNTVNSYWIRKEKRRIEISDYEKQF